MVTNRAALTLCGDLLPCGSYLLQIQVHAPVGVRFGAFRQSAPVQISAGHAVYIGSAMGRSGSTTLGRRLLRHATRSSGAPAHPLQATLIHRFGIAPPQRKRLRWHIDYLLELPQVALTGAVALCSTRRLEPSLAELIDRDAGAAPPATGIGAGDHPGATHLYCYTGPAAAYPAWWEAIIRQACALTATTETTA